MADGSNGAARCVALIGPQSAGKTSLLEAMLFRAEATPRMGSIKDGSTVGDGTEEARDKHMSTEPNIVRFDYLGQPWTVIDCPGAVELSHQTREAVMVADMAVIVCEPDPERLIILQPLLRDLTALGLPHALFINKMDTAQVRIAEVMAALQQVSGRPLALRQVPIRDGDQTTGCVDLVSERAYRYRAAAPSELIALPPQTLEREQEARQEMLEVLADFDDALLEQLLEDQQPSPEEIFEQLQRDIGEGLVVPVYLGAAEPGYGVTRLLKALRHDGPGPAAALERRSLPEDAVLAEVFRTDYALHVGKMSYARLWRGSLHAGDNVGGAKLGGLYHPGLQGPAKVDRIHAGDVVAINRLDPARTGEWLKSEAREAALDWPTPPEPTYALAIRAERQADEVKLTGALARAVEEDASLAYGHEEGTGELTFRGQGEVHLQLALARLRRKSNVSAQFSPPLVPYQETITKSVQQHSRFKRQTGGHGQFADVQVEIKPLARGEGFTFHDKIVGGAIPRGFIPAVETGARDSLAKGPLGFPVVDVSMTLFDGQFHSVDSSEQAFRTAGRMALSEGLAEARPILLEPIWQVRLILPNAYTPKAQRMLSGRRGQILGFDAHPEWEGWDIVDAYLPRSEMSDLIIELRSLSQGAGTFTAKFDHMSQLTGRDAERVISEFGSGSS